MNYYMPYFNMYPYMAAPSATASRGLFSRLLGGGLNWGSILSTTQKTLNVVNQAIPVIKQVTPVMKNAKTIFKVMNEFKRVDSPSDNSINSDSQTSIKSEDIKDDTLNSNLVMDGSPTFFIN